MIAPTSTDLALRVLRGELQLNQQQEQLALDLAETFARGACEALVLGGFRPPRGEAAALLGHFLKVMLLGAILDGVDGPQLEALAPHCGAVAVGQVFGSPPVCN